MWTRVLEVLQREADVAGHLQWETHHVDGTVVRAHQHAAGAVGGQLLINRMKQHRRIATRYETRAAHYAGRLTIAAPVT